MLTTGSPRTNKYMALWAVGSLSRLYNFTAMAQKQEQTVQRVWLCHAKTLFTKTRPYCPHKDYSVSLLLLES